MTDLKYGCDLYSGKYGTLAIARVQSNQVTEAGVRVKVRLYIGSD